MIGVGDRRRLSVRRGVLAISVVSVPLMLDRDVGLADGDRHLAARRHGQPRPDGGMGPRSSPAALVLGSLPLFLGLIVVMPVLGHATWHLYRRVVASE